MTATLIEAPAIKVLDEKITKGANGTRELYFVEVPPQSVSTSIGNKMYNLELPWCYYVMTIHGVGHPENRWYPETADGKAARSRISSIRARSRASYGGKSPLYYMPMPNQYGGTRTFCANGGKVDAEEREQRINQAICNFWDSNFSYLVLGNQPKVWANIAKLAGQGNPGRGTGYREMDYIYTWWESLPADEVLGLPWGRVKLDTIDTLKASQYYGYESYG